MMRLTGKKTTIDRVEVDISEKDIYKAVRQILSKKFKNCSGDNYITEDGVWMMYEGDNHHNGDPEYGVGEKVTQTEKDIESFMKLLWEICE